MTMQMIRPYYITFGWGFLANATYNMVETFKAFKSNSNDNLSASMSVVGSTVSASMSAIVCGSAIRGDVLWRPGFSDIFEDGEGCPCSSRNR